jgi:hypothetical protein
VGNVEDVSVVLAISTSTVQVWRLMSLCVYYSIGTGEREIEEEVGYFF